MTVLEAVILAGGEDKRLNPLTAPDHPKCLLPVGNAPVLQYSLRTLNSAGVKSAIVVVCGDTAAALVKKYLQKEPLAQGMAIQVVTAASESGSADAVRAVADKLVGECVVVMSGDVATDVSLRAVVFQHTIRGCAATTVLGKRSTSASESTKPGKPPQGVNYVALNDQKTQLLTYAYHPQQLRSVPVPTAAVDSCASVHVTTDLADAGLYVLSRPVIATIASQPKISSIKLALLPLLVNDQWTASREGSDARPSQGLDQENNGLEQSAAQYLQTLSPGWRPATGTQAPTSCGAFIVPEANMCIRINTLKTLLDCNRSVAGQAGVSSKTAVHPSVELGSKTTVGKDCLVGESTVLGDRSSVKRSVVSTCCKIGSSVKIINSVVMEGCVIGDNVHIQNSVLGQKVTIGSRAQLKDCYIGHGYAVPENADHRDETLAAV